MDGTDRILYVRDPDDAAAPEPAALRADGLAVDAAGGMGAGVDRLVSTHVDCVVSTQALPDGDGLTFLRRVRDLDGEIPFVLLAPDGSERLASRAVAAGVTDYVPIDRDGGFGAVAERVAAASEPTSTEAQVRELTEATEDVLWLISADWEELLFVNSAYAELFGQPERRLRAEPRAFLEAVHPDDRERTEAAMERLADGESQSIELRVNPEEGFQRHVLVQAEPITGPDGSIERFAGATRDITEQRARQRRLEEERRTVESIFDALPDVLYTFDTAGYLLRWNDQLEAETGYDADEIEEMYVTDFVPDDEIEKIADSFQAILEEGRSVTVESAFETKSGERVPFEFTGGPLRDADGELRGVTGIGRNISDRRARQRRFEAVFDNTYQFTGLMSPDGTLLEVNETAAAFAGRPAEELVGQKLWDAYWFEPEETTREVARAAVEAARGGEFFRERITVRGADRDAVIDFSVRPVTDDRGEVDLLIPEGRDITRLAQRDQQLRVTNRFLRHNIRNKLNTIRGHATLVADRDDDRLRSTGETIVEAADELNETAETARDVHELIGNEPEPRSVDLVVHLDRAVEAVRRRHPAAEVDVQRPASGSVPVSGVASLHEALTDLLELLLSYADADRPTLRAEVGADDATLTVTSEDCTLPAAEREVLTGDIEINQVRHAQGLGVWNVYWHVWYSGGSVEVLGDDGVRLRLSPA